MLLFLQMMWRKCNCRIARLCNWITNFACVISYDGNHSNKTVSDPGGQDDLKKWDIGNDYSHKWSLYWVITSKSLFSGGIKIWLGESNGRFQLKGGLPPGDSLLPPFHPVGKILRNMGNHKKCRTFRREFGNANS